MRSFARPSAAFVPSAPGARSIASSAKKLRNPSRTPISAVAAANARSVATMR